MLFSFLFLNMCYQYLNLVANAMFLILFFFVKMNCSLANKRILLRFVFFLYFQVNFGSANSQICPAAQVVLLFGSISQDPTNRISFEPYRMLSSFFAPTLFIFPRINLSRFFYPPFLPYVYFNKDYPVFRI